MQSWHLGLYTPDFVYKSVTCCLCVSNLWTEIQRTHAQGLNNTTPTRVYNTTEKRLHTHQAQELPDTQEIEE